MVNLKNKITIFLFSGLDSNPGRDVCVALDFEQSLFSSKIRGKKRKTSKRANLTESVTARSLVLPKTLCAKVSVTPRLFGCHELITT